MADQDGVRMQLANITTVTEFLNLQNLAIPHLIESITYNPQSQNVIIKLASLLKIESDQIQRGAVLPDLDAEEALEKLSERYRRSYPQFLEHFKNWKPKRKELITKLNTSAKQIDLNFSLVSVLRILTSTADIVAALKLFQDKMSPLGAIAIESASIVGILGLCLEKQQAKEYYLEVKKILTEDLDIFEELKKWFQQTDELDRAVKTFFPYGIDEDIVRIFDKAPTMTDKYYKLFASVLASNVKNDANLFTDRYFLDKAENFATSEAGIQWFNKVILEEDPFANECLKRDLTTEIARITTAAIQNPEVFVGTSAWLAPQTKVKLLLSGVTIVSSIRNLWKNGKSEDSDVLRQLAKTAERELTAIQRVLELLRPSGFDIRNALQ